MQWPYQADEKYIKGCVRLENPDLDLKSGFRILQSIREIRPRGGFQLKNPHADFMDFIFTVRLGNPKKDLQNCYREQRSSFC